jgi:hypothetical protein
LSVEESDIEGSDSDLTFGEGLFSRTFSCAAITAWMSALRFLGDVEKKANRFFKPGMEAFLVDVRCGRSSVCQTTGDFSLSISAAGAAVAEN